jgi:hypothetical protein
VFWEEGCWWLVSVLDGVYQETYIRNGGVVNHFELDAGVEGVEERLEGKG